MAYVVGRSFGPLTENSSAIFACLDSRWFNNSNSFFACFRNISGKYNVTYLND